MSKWLYRELKSVMLGEKLGQGVAREVFASRMNDQYVIKIETKGRSFQNVAEWETWQWVEGGPMAKWFAPCLFISTCGSMLVQRRVEPLRSDERPPKLPQFLCDLKRENFGMLDRKVVCCDYGTVQSAIRTVSQRLKKAEWRS